VAQDHREAEHHPEGEYRALSARSVDQGPGPPHKPLVLLHGFTQTASSWAPVIDELHGRFPLVLPDAPGHGGSSLARADLWATADLLAETVHTPATWVGYSMGGRTALHIALSHPDLVEGLVLISTTAGIEDETLRAERRAADEALAQRVEKEGTEAFLGWWLSQPLFATLPPARAALQERLANTPAGLASSLRLAGAGVQEPLWDRLPQLAARDWPILLIAGALDRRYCDHAERMAAAIGPTAAVSIIPDAGHACHLERPGQVAAAIAGLRPPARSERQADRQ
jgi:2-succinyl-6-hydroxy-2,4-cyclohexadiene-1-carboxylate synthase